MLFTFLTIVTRWSRSTSNFNALIGQNLTSEFMRSFVSTRDVFNCLFPLDVQNEIQLLSRVFCYSWLLVCLLNFLVEKCAACQRRKSDFGWHRFCFLTLLDA